MEKPTIKNIIKLIIDVVIIVCAFLALARHFYNALESVFIDHTNTLLGSSNMSLFTTNVNIAACVVCIIDVPFKIASIIKNKDISFRALTICKYIVAVSLIMTFFIVVFLIFPVTCVYMGSFEIGFRIDFMGGNFYTHIAIPFLFVLSFTLLEEKTEFSLLTNILVVAPLFVYSIIYTIFAFILKTWEDVYYLFEVIQVIKIIGLTAVVLLAHGVCFLVGMFIRKIKKSRTSSLLN